MSGIWFILSAICFGAAAYLLKKRSSYVYAPKEVVYSAAKGAPAPSAHVHTEPAPIEAEYSVDSRNMRPSPPLPTTPFFSEMSGAINAQAAPQNPPAPVPPPDMADENEPPASLKNIRFFDS